MDEIEVVIKMPKNTYRQIQALARNNYFEHDICGNSMRRIANGIPLPKGHGRLIDADRLIKAERMWYRLKNGDVACPKIDIENAPTIIEADKTESEG